MEIEKTKPTFIISVLKVVYYVGLVYQISNYFINKTSQRKKKFFWKRKSFCHNFLHVLTNLWAFCLVTSPKIFQIWDLLHLSFQLKPCMLSLTKIENWPNIWKWNAKAIKHKCGGGGGGGGSKIVKICRTSFMYVPL